MGTFRRGHVERISKQSAQKSPQNSYQIIPLQSNTTLVAKTYNSQISDIAVKKIKSQLVKGGKTSNTHSVQ